MTKIYIKKIKCDILYGSKLKICQNINILELNLPCIKLKVKIFGKTSLGFWQ